MKTPLEITFRDLDHSAAVNAHIRNKALKLEQYCHYITSCHVVAETMQTHHRPCYEIHITLKVPQKELVSHASDEENLYKAIAQAFDKIQRQLEHHIQHMEGHVKHHDATLDGKVVRLFDEFGFIEIASGDEFYFNRSNLTKPVFNQLKVGDTVSFIEGDYKSEGPQACRVKVTRKRAL